MDAAIKQLLDGFKMGIDAQSALISDKALVDEVRAVIAQMEAVAQEPGMDMMKFQERLTAEGLMGKYGDAMAKLGEAQAAGLEQKIAEVDEAAAAAKPIDLATLDITDLDVVVAPHRQVYNTTVKGNETLPHQRAAYEGLFALAEECKTIPEFNRRAKAEGHLDHLGLSATWDANVNTFRVEVQHKQPDMITYALDALAATRDKPFPETIVYALSRLALLNERTMARRLSSYQPYIGFGGELSGYLVLDHSENQRQKAVNTYRLQQELTGLDVAAAEFHPYLRQLLTMGDATQSAKHGPDYLGLLPFLRAGWFVDASLSPEEKKARAERGEMPRPPAYQHPHRTGPVGGVELTLAEPPFAVAFDEPYPAKLTLTNHAAEGRELDAKKGLKMWVITEEGAKKKRVADVPAALGPGEAVEVEGDLYGWGLPKEERLFLVAFDVGVAGEHKCDLAAKYADVKNLAPQFIPNHFLEPFEGGAATDPAFALPHRPVPAYPFPKAVE